MMKPETKKLISKITGVATIVLVALVLSLISNFVLERTAPVQKTTIQAPLTPWQQKDTMNHVLIVSEFKNSVKDGQPDSSFEKHISVVGSIDRGYLYIKANVNGSPLSVDDRVYLSLLDGHTGQQVGGRLVQDKSLDTETPKSANSTEFFYDLSNVQYEKNGGDEVETISGDWLKMLNQNQGDLINALGFTSTLRNGDIEEVTLYYTCSTGSNCSVTTTD